MAYYGIWGGFTLAYSAVGIPSFLEDPNRPFDMSKHAQAWFRGFPICAIRATKSD